MAKWYQWLYLSLGFCVGGILNLLDGKGVVSFVPALGTAILAIIQFLCVKKGKAGKKASMYIGICAIVLLVIWLIYLLLT